MSWCYCLFLLASGSALARPSIHEEAEFVLHSAKIGKRSELTREHFAPPLHATSAQGTNFIFSFLNSRQYASDNVTESLTLTVSNPGSSLATFTITSPYSAFTTIQGTVQPYQSNLVTILPYDIQTNFGDPYWDSLIVENKTLTLTSDQPVLLVGGNSHDDRTNIEKFTILPVCLLGTEYHVVGDESSYYSRLQSSNQFTAIAAQDSTTITVGAYGSQAAQTVTINAGQQVTLTTYWWTTNILVTSDKPIAVLSGAVCGYGYYNENKCGHEALMLLPVTNFGLEIPYYRFLPETSGEFMILSQANDTDLSYNGNVVFTGLTVDHYVIFRVATGAYITATKPIYGVAVGASNSDDIGGPYFANLPSTQNLVSTPVTFGVGLTDYDKSLTNYLRLITQLSNIGKVYLDGYAPSGLIYNRMGKGNYYSVDIPLTSGTHNISTVSGATFGATVYGYGNLQAYAYTIGVDASASGTC